MLWFLTFLILLFIVMFVAFRQQSKDLNTIVRNQAEVLSSRHAVYHINEMAKLDGKITDDKLAKAKAVREKLKSL